MPTCSQCEHSISRLRKWLCLRDPKGRAVDSYITHSTRPVWCPLPVPGRQTTSTDQPFQLTATDDPVESPMRKLWLKLGDLIRLGEAAKLLDDHHSQLRVSSEDVDVRLDSDHWHEFIVAVRKYRQEG